MEQLKTKDYGCTELNATEAKEISGGLIPGLPDLGGLLKPITDLVGSLLGTVTSLLSGLLGGLKLPL